MAQDSTRGPSYHPWHGDTAVRRFVIPAIAFTAGTALMAGIYLGVLSWLEGWDYAAFQFSRDRAYVVPILLAFGIQAALYSVIRFRLYGPVQTARMGGVMMGSSGGMSATAMVACCLHHATNVLPILGISAATAFLARYQRPFMQVGLVMNLLGILIMLVALQRARQGPSAVLEPS
jgi:hypothetical protein